MALPHCGVKGPPEPPLASEATVKKTPVPGEVNAMPGKSNNPAPVPFDVDPKKPIVKKSPSKKPVKKTTDKKSTTGE